MSTGLAGRRGRTELTAWGGAALLVQAVRSLDLPGSTRCHVHIKQRQRGFDEAAYVESLVVLHALGGDCVDDLDRLREDPGIAEVLGDAVPSPEAARKSSTFSVLVPWRAPLDFFAGLAHLASSPQRCG